jgi:hypothetical protein
MVNSTLVDQILKYFLILGKGALESDIFEW